YKVVLPFTGILTIALLLVSYVPILSDITIRGDISAARAQAEKSHVPPREAWLMECVQEDTTNPQPCSDADKKRWPKGQEPQSDDNGAIAPTVDDAADAGGGEGDDDEALLRMMAGGGDGGAAPEPTNGGVKSDDELLKEMMGGDADAGAAPEPTPSASATGKKSADDELLEEMMNSGKK
ncbi:MAG: hypothetical protein ABI551_16810, partial [Polyangiaceae bacterium]